MIAVAGGSGSGKTTFAQLLKKRLGENRCLVIEQDSYYHDRSGEFDHDGGRVNFDHPDAIDWSLLLSHIRQLKHGKPIDVPIYDFNTHSRKTESLRVEPKEYMIVDGILILVPFEVCSEFTIKIFIETNEELRFRRRLMRDVQERGRTPEGVHNQFYNQVKPMHDQFVEPSKANADLVISGEVDFSPALEQVINDTLVSL